MTRTKTALIQIRVTPEQKEAIRAKAELLGLTVSDWILQLAALPGEEDVEVAPQPDGATAPAQGSSSAVSAQRANIGLVAPELLRWSCASCGTTEFNSQSFANRDLCRDCVT